MCPQDLHDVGDEKDKEKDSLIYEFECPVCNANNPYDEGFSAGDEVRCFYCGSEFKVRIDEGTGRPRYKEF